MDKKKRQPVRKMVTTAFVFAVVIASAFADPLTLTWNGGASGSFSTGPWSGGASGHDTPQNGDTLVFGTGGTFENDISGLSVAGLSFTSATAVTLTGSQIAVANGGALATTGAGEVTFSAPLSLGTAATPIVTIDVASGCTNTFNACVSGAANIEYTNEGTVNLRANSDYTGTTRIRLGQIHVYANNAFGSTAGNTTYSPAAKTSNANVHFHGVTMDESFEVPSKNRRGAFTFPNGTTNVFNGAVRETDACYFTYGENVKVSYNGVTYFINPGCSIPSSSVIELNGEGSGFAKWGDYWQGTGRIYYNAKCYYENTSQPIRLGSATKRYFNCENAALYNPALPAGIRLLANNCRIDMCGYDQTFAYLRCEATYSGCVITSDAPSTVHLTLGGSSAVTNCAKIGGPISLSFEGSQSMSLGSANASTGFLSLTNEADITLLPDFGWGGSSVTVSDGSSLTINAVTFPENLSLTINDRAASGGAAAKFSRITLNADRVCKLLKINGVAMEGGKTYGSSASGADVQDDDHFAGPGQLMMSMPSPLTLTWNGGASGSFSTGPWSGGEEGHMKPMRGDTLVFGTGGTFENDISGLSVAGLSFTSATAVTLTGSQIAVANGGALATTGAGEVTFSVPLSLGTVATPIVTIDVASGCTNTFNACVSGAANIEYTNEGTVNLRANSDYTGTTRIRLGQIHVYANNAFGSTAGNTTYSPAAKTSNANVHFHGVTMDESFEVPSKNRSGAFTFPNGTTNVFNGAVRETDACHFTYGDNVKVSYNGVTYFINPGCRIPSSSVIEFNGEGSGFAKWGDYWEGTGRIYYNAKCYYEPNQPVRVGSATKRYFNCENAILYKPESPAGISLVFNNSRLDMCGHNQTFAYISCGVSYSGCVITSDAPSTVHLTLGGSSAVTNCAKIGGPISLSFEGSQPMSLGSANASTGFLSLTNEADITLLSGFGWGGNSLSVTDGSTLTIAGSTTFPHELALAVSDRVASQGVAAKSSSLVLNANLTVDTLTVNGVDMLGGRTYGSSSSAAAVKDDVHFAGTGVLRVRTPCGMRIEIR